MFDVPSLFLLSLDPLLQLPYQRGRVGTSVLWRTCTQNKNMLTTLFSLNDNHFQSLYHIVKAFRFEVFRNFFLPFSFYRGF